MRGQEAEITRPKRNTPTEELPVASPDVAKPGIGLEPGAEFPLPVSVAAAALGGGENGGGREAGALASLHPETAGGEIETAPVKTLQGPRPCRGLRETGMAG